VKTTAPISVFERMPRVAARPAAVRSRLTDVLCVVALLVFGLLIRRNVLPRDGLLFDDAWVVLGAGKAKLGDMLSVTTLQPGFTTVLRPWYDLVSGATERMAIPSLVAGAISGAVVFVVLRRWSVARVVSLTMSAIVVAAPVAVMYSGRVKPYVFEIVLVTVLAAVLPVLCTRNWGWPTVALWIFGSLALAGFSAYMLPAAVAAGIVVAFHPHHDVIRRSSAVAVQAVLTALYLSQVQGSFDSEGTNRGWEGTWNAYIEFANPLTMAREIAVHIGRLGEVVVGTSGVVGFAIVTAAVAGLVLESRRGDRRIAARYLLLLLAIAFAGGLTRRIPFGPASGSDADVYPGLRASLWLLPSLAIGLAFVLDRAARALRRTSATAAAWCAVVLVAFAALVIGTNVHDSPAHPLAGSRSAHEFVARRAGPRDVLLMFSNSLWTYAAEPEVDVRIKVDARLLNGFTPVLVDNRIWTAWPTNPWNGTIAQLREHTANATNVFVVDGYVGVYDWEMPKLRSALREIGFQSTDAMKAGTYEVEMWTAP
jgi:hypothetical protein